MRKKTVNILVVSVFVIGVAVILHGADDWKRKAADGDAGLPQKERAPVIFASQEPERSSVRRSDRKESPPSPPGELPEGWRGLEHTAVPPSPEVVKAAERVGKIMLDDEASRTSLVREEKKDGRTVYRFELSRREDYNRYLDDLLRREAKAAGVDAGTLGGLVRQNLKDLDIPQGHQQFVEIVVPLNPKEEASFKGFSMSPEDVGKASYRVKIAFAGVVPIGAKEWRYSRLLDLGNP